MIIKIYETFACKCIKIISKLEKIVCKYLKHFGGSARLPAATAILLVYNKNS